MRGGGGGGFLDNILNIKNLYIHHCTCFVIGTAKMACDLR